MIRPSFLAAALAVSACAEPPPPPVEAEIIERAVRHAQDQIDSRSGAAQSGSEA